MRVLNWNKIRVPGGRLLVNKCTNVGTCADGKCLKNPGRYADRDEHGIDRDINNLANYSVFFPN